MPMRFKPAILLRKVTMSGVVRPVFTWSSRGGHAERPDRGRAMPAHAPDLAGHFDGRGLAVGARSPRPPFRDKARRISRRDRRSSRRGSGSARCGTSGDRRFGPGDHRDRAAVTASAMKSSPLKTLPRNAPNTLPRATLRWSIAKPVTSESLVDVREVAQLHRPAYFLVFVNEGQHLGHVGLAVHVRARRRASARSG